MLHLIRSHYARVPRELWRERLVKMKRAGFNTVSTYVFWNAQEPAPGVFEFGDTSTSTLG